MNSLYSRFLTKWLLIQIGDEYKINISKKNIFISSVFKIRSNNIIFNLMVLLGYTINGRNSVSDCLTVVLTSFIIYMKYIVFN